MKNALGTSAQRIALMEKAGLLTTGERGSKYDRFRHRVMFPILDRRGRTIAFGGRVLVKEDTPKYLNSPETPLFHKGRELFGLWQVREAHQKIPRLIVVEGYMDVISLHQFGVPQAVATLGTATTRDHAEILFRQCADVYFCFDGDRAGRQAAWRAVESVLPRMRDGRQAMFLFLPDGEDPDTLIRAEGTKGFEERLRTATPLSEFFFAEIGKDVNLSTLDGKARLAERARPMLAQIPDGAFRDLMLAELDRSTGVHVEVASPASDASAPRSKGKPQQRSLVRSAVALLVQTPQLAAAIEPPWTFSELRQPGIPLLVELIALCRDRPDITTGSLLEHFAEREEARALQKLAVMDFPGGAEEARIEFVDALRQLEKQTVQQRIDDLMAKQSAGGLADAEKHELRQLLANKGAA
jgi:DNA primase